jgi:hypothetical protein
VVKAVSDYVNPRAYEHYCIVDGSQRQTILSYNEDDAQIPDETIRIDDTEKLYAAEAIQFVVDELLDHDAHPQVEEFAEKLKLEFNSTTTTEGETK